jgi:hypothetical protein
MPQIYLHYFGNESCESLLEAYGIVTNDHKQDDKLRSKQCPNCNEPNKPDSRFCAKCRMVLTYDAYSETLESQNQSDAKYNDLAEKMNNEMRAMTEKVNASLESCNREMDKLRPAGKELRSIMDGLGPVLEKLGIKLEK